MKKISFLTARTITSPSASLPYSSFSLDGLANPIALLNP
jgi:hypothetical protein